MSRDTSVCGVSRRWLVVLVAIATIAGCEKSREQSTPELEFEREEDTTGLSKGPPVINGIEPYRAPNGMLRVRGRVSLPDGVRIQISLYRRDTNEMLSRVQVIVDHHRFESPPIMGAKGPLPKGAYRFEYLALFNEAWQTPEVMRATAGGRDLRGPGITRDRAGGAAFYLVEDRTL